MCVCVNVTYKMARGKEKKAQEKNRAKMYIMANIPPFLAVSGDSKSDVQGNRQACIVDRLS